MEVDAADLDLDNSSSEELFVFHESVSTLQNIASHTVALQLWHHYLSRAKCCGKIQEKTYDFFIKVFNLGGDYRRESKKLAELLRTPRGIEEMLKESLKKIDCETSQWVNHFNCSIFRDGMSRYCPSNFDPNLIVWHQNDKIDYRKSAAKMLIEGKLNVEQKFVLMCAYGMATELYRFPINLLSEYFCLLGISDSNLIAAYWISYHKPDLCEIWLGMPDVFRPEDTSIHVTMAIECAKWSLPHAFEHFWSRLNDNEQTSVAVRILPEGWKVVKIMLSTMSYFRQLQLVDQIPAELMRTFFIRHDPAEFYRPVSDNVRIVWTLVKDRITEQQFVQFLKEVCYDDDAMVCEEYMILLIKIWDTASDRLKRHIVENHPDVLFISFMLCDEYSPSSYKFFMKFLPLVNEHTRKELYLDLNVHDIASKCDIDILNLCLPEEADQLQLKNRIMESPDMVDYCAALLHDKKFDEVITVATFFSRNAHDAREFFKKALESDRINDNSFILEYESWNKLSNFIDKVFTNDLSTVSRLKKRLVSSHSARVIYCWDKKENVDALVQITEQVFSPEEMKSFKQTLLEHFQKEISSPKRWHLFKGKCFNTFVSWCSGDENKIVDLKNIVPIDAFFDEIFRTICSSPDNDPQNLLNKLDEFLRYVCVSDEEVELLKIRKYHDRDRYWIREVDRVFDSLTRRMIFNWFRSVKN
ncbi:uncharacterized protein LOC135839954 isoform X3 [Planococcus citri]|uniref:uncharacterized protein LOC135839954 isoform X3 n=1 Tax=Planococcus citri TaxID=170843 RepID=UPI0031F9997B